MTTDRSGARAAAPATIVEAWAAFDRAFDWMPDPTRRLLRLAFYTGASASFEAYTGVADLPDDVGVARLEALEQEFARFAAEVVEELVTPGGRRAAPPAKENT